MADVAQKISQVAAISNAKTHASCDKVLKGALYQPKSFWLLVG